MAVEDYTSGAGMARAIHLAQRRTLSEESRYERIRCTRFKAQGYGDADTKLARTIKAYC